MFIQYQLKHKHLLLFLVATTLILACGNDECGLICRRPEPTIENIWPNGDGTFWTYEYTLRAWKTDVTTYPEKDSLPPVPSMDEIEGLLGHHPIGSNPNTLEGTYMLEFNGLTTTASGVTAQNLEESVVTANRRGRPVAGTGRLASFLERLRLARPDLRAEIDVLYPNLDSTAQPGTPPSPNMIHGGAWEKTDQWIGTYGDVDTLLAWKFLEADLTEGHEFTHQLIPSLAGDIFLHCRVLGRTVVKSPAGHFWRALECLYVVDYGPFEIRGEWGTESWRQYYDYGRVVYVPEIGPVYDYERTLIAVGKTIGTGYGDIKVELTGSSLETD